MELLARYDVAFHTRPVGKHPRHVALQIRGPVPQRSYVTANERGRQARALPQLVVRGLGHRGPEATLQLGLERRQLAPLALEAARFGEVELDL